MQWADFITSQTLFDPPLDVLSNWLAKKADAICLLTPNVSLNSPMLTFTSHVSHPATGDSLVAMKAEKEKVTAFKPTCNFCGAAHWSDECNKFPTTSARR